MSTCDWSAHNAGLAWAQCGPGPGPRAARARHSSQKAENEHNEFSACNTLLRKDDSSGYQHTKNTEIEAYTSIGLQ